MIPRRPLAVLATASLLALAGCSDGPFAPIGALAGRQYMLTHVNAGPLPGVVWSEPAGARLEIVGESIRFRAFGRVERARTYRHVGADGAAETTTLRTTTYYRVRDEPTEISSPGIVVRIASLVPCPAPAPTELSVACDPEEQAIVNDDELRLTSVAYGAMSATTLVLRFERVDPADYAEAQRGGR